jgi:hypothetical protein
VEAQHAIQDMASDAMSLLEPDVGPSYPLRTWESFAVLELADPRLETKAQTDLLPHRKN